MFDFNYSFKSSPPCGPDRHDEVVVLQLEVLDGAAGALAHDVLAQYLLPVVVHRAAGGLQSRNVQQHMALVNSVYDVVRNFVAAMYCVVHTVRYNTAFSQSISFLS
jgi:hypothetical protein